MSSPSPRGSLETLVPLPQLKSNSKRQRVANPIRHPRIHGWTWQGFPVGMGTGAVAICLSGLRSFHPAILALATMFYFLNIFIFGLNIIMLSLQFFFYPAQSKKLIVEPSTGVFVPLSVLSFATIIINSVNYHDVGYVSTNAIVVLFWIYVTLAILICFLTLMIWFNNPHELDVFTPASAFLVFPLMHVGVVAFSVLKIVPPLEMRALGILLTGYMFQGFGFLMNLFYIGIYIFRVMTTGFLAGNQTSSTFVTCGPPGFTALAFINLADKARTILSNHELISPIAGEVWYSVSVLLAIPLFGLAVFFCVFGALPYWFKVQKSLGGILGCWALIFPNVGWILTLRSFGDIFQLMFFTTWNVIMTVIVFFIWVTLFILTFTAFCKGKIFYTQPVVDDPHKKATTMRGDDETIYSGCSSRDEDEEV